MVFESLKKIPSKIKKSFESFLNKFFRKKKEIKLGLYGPVNAGKTSLANVICMDWIGEELGKVSKIPHETREIQMKEKVEMKHGNKKLDFNIIDTPGIATKIDFEDFVKKGLKAKEAKTRAKEATKGVIEAIKWLDSMDLVLVVLDASLDPLTQVNITILGNLDARNIPVIIVANKIDLRNARLDKIRNAFPQYKIVGISAKKRTNIEELYKTVFETIRRG